MLQEDFGKDLGVVHEAVVTGRKVGADNKFWSALAHCRELFAKVVELVKNEMAFQVWKTIKLGTYKDAKVIQKAHPKAGCKISDWAKDILGKPAFTVATEETKVDLVKVSVAELDFKDGARYDKICARAKERGLDLCPAEVGPQLRLQYLDQPANEWLRIAMEPITDSDGHSRLFCVVRFGGGLWLYGGCGSPGYFWGGGSQFVFVARK